MWPPNTTKQKRWKEVGVFQGSLAPSPMRWVSSRALKLVKLVLAFRAVAYALVRECFGRTKAHRVLPLFNRGQSCLQVLSPSLLLLSAPRLASDPSSSLWVISSAVSKHTQNTAFAV